MANFHLLSLILFEADNAHVQNHCSSEFTCRICNCKESTKCQNTLPRYVWVCEIEDVNVNIHQEAMMILKTIQVMKTLQITLTEPAQNMKSSIKNTVI